MNDLPHHFHYLNLPPSQWNRLSIQLCQPTKSSCEKKKATKTFPIFFKPPHSTDWYLYLCFSHPRNYHLPDLLMSSHFHPFVLHLKIVEFWWAQVIITKIFADKLLIHAIRHTYLSLHFTHSYLFIWVLMHLKLCCDVHHRNVVMFCIVMLKK